jgi:hypothetical protein
LGDVKGFCCTVEIATIGYFQKGADIFDLHRWLKKIRVSGFSIKTCKISCFANSFLSLNSDSGKQQE